MKPIKPIKKLNLDRETIRPLSTDELADVAGGTSTIAVSISTVSVTFVVSIIITTKQ